MNQPKPQILLIPPFRGSHLKSLPSGGVCSIRGGDATVVATSQPGSLGGSLKEGSLSKFRRQPNHLPQQARIRAILKNKCKDGAFLENLKGPRAKNNRAFYYSMNSI